MWNQMHPGEPIMRDEQDDGPLSCSSCGESSDSTYDGRCADCYVAWLREADRGTSER